MKRTVQSKKGRYSTYDYLFVLVRYLQFINTPIIRIVYVKLALPLAGSERLLSRRVAIFDHFRFTA